jgi:hypothetical protein
LQRARPCATCVFLCERDQTFKSSRLSRSPKLSTLKSASLQSGSELNRTVVIPIFLAYLLLPRLLFIMLRTPSGLL